MAVEAQRCPREDQGCDCIPGHNPVGKPGTTFKLFELWAFPERPMPSGTTPDNAMAVGTPTIEQSPVDTAIVETVFVNSTIASTVVEG
ncbi:hypothetical protein TNIN_207111 [Trichonephila inaurata madagascariensis]|uniref:Uncharacterized protein n=1 Tax=Trichonephila inaurata madagascariensis TaxID=2747483 RepID=A0A8X6XL04_9ARAC|nr:hypothetical protein TNIN_207111 [Trichonephila inaurata madagascariensis]